MRQGGELAPALILKMRTLREVSPSKHADFSSSLASDRFFFHSHGQVFHHNRGFARKGCAAAFEADGSTVVETLTDTHGHIHTQHDDHQAALRDGHDRQPCVGCAALIDLIFFSGSHWTTVSVRCICAFHWRLSSAPWRPCHPHCRVPFGVT